MTKLLIVNAKYSNIYFDITTPELEARAWLAFAGFCSMQGFYYDINKDDEPDQYAALVGARSGNWEDAKWLCQQRSDYEYEEWYVEHTVSDRQLGVWIDKLQ